MRKKFICIMLAISLLFIFIVSLINGNFMSAIPRVSKEQAAFNDFTDSLFASEVSANAFNLHFYLNNPKAYGITDAPLTIGSMKYDDMKNCDHYYMDLIEQIKSFDYDKLSDDGKLTYDILQYYLSCELDFSDLCLNYQPLSPTIGLQAQLPVLLSQYTLNNENDALTYIKLLCTLGSYFEEIIEFEKIKAEHGLFMSKQTLTDITFQCNNFINAEDNFLIRSFEERLEKIKKLSDSKRAELVELNNTAVEQKVIPAYQYLVEELNNLSDSCTKNLGLSHFDNGKEYYNYLVRTSTGSSKTISQIETMIQNRLAYDFKILSSLSKDNYVASALIQNDDVKISDSPKEILQSLIKKMNDDFPAPATTHFKVNYVPDSLEEHLSPAFYLSPPIDDINNNQIFINRYDEMSGAELFVTLAHEGYPGHLYQSTYFSDTSPMLIRHLLDFGGYTEGWATYVELYSYSYLYNDSKIVKALTSNASYSLALYCLADIGINYHGWTYKDTCKFFETYGVDDIAVVSEIYNRMVAEPANYLQYYVGYLEILELKDKMKKIKGDDFSIREFHTYILDMGPAPFEILEQHIVNSSAMR